MRWLKLLEILLAAALCAAICPALAEDDMPVVVDQPLTPEELDALTARTVEELAPTQQLLIDLGYLTGRADGIMGPKTQEALCRFQAERGLTVTGKLDIATLSAAEAVAATISDAKARQQRLYDLGYLDDLSGGVYGERTTAALRLFQTLNGLEATGEADAATQAKLTDPNAATLPQRLSRGAKGDAVTALQERLIQFGFLEGEPDGSYGKRTARAVSDFQEHLIAQGIGERLGIEATGEATGATQALLMDPDYSSYLMNLTLGAEGDEVRRVERRLADLGYMDARADERFDAYAAQAARAFQEAAHLPRGPFSKAAVDALFAVDAPVAGHFVPHDIAYGDRGIAVREASELLVACGITVSMPDRDYDDTVVESVQRLYEYLAALNSPQAALFEDSTRLSLEAQQALHDGVLRYVSDIGEPSTEEEIRRLQRRLHTLFYLARYDVDGLFGETTVEALKRFQEDNGLPVTGVANKATQQALFSTEAACKAYPYRVEVDIDSQRVNVYQLNGSGGYDQIHTFICSTGLGGTTPRGIFLNGYPANRWHHFEKYNCWAQYSFEIEGNIMFHSVIYSSNDTDSLREGSVYALGSKASHGCIRLRVQDAKWLFENCKRGSLVIVIY